MVKKLPRLRAVEMVPFVEGGQRRYLLRDPLAFAPAPLVLSAAGALILSCLDGQHTEEQLRQRFLEASNGQTLPTAQLNSLLGTLHDGFFLEGPATQERIAAVVQEYERSPIRPAWLAGQGYPEDPAELRQLLDGFYDDEAGAGPLEGLPAAGRAPDAIVAPHIDLRVGGMCCTHAFKTLRAAERPDCFVILGVAHSGSEEFFTASAKDFVTPLGTSRGDKELLADWSRRAGRDLSTHQWLQRAEHSVEFPVLFLQHLLGHQNYTILPVILGSPEPYLEQGTSPLADNQIRAEADALKEALAARGRRTALIVSVDLAHKGPKFGDQKPITKIRAGRLEEADRATLDHVAAGRVEAFLAEMQESRNERNIDAVSGLLTMFHLLPGATGRLLDYRQNLQPDTRSAVTYASMAFSTPV